MQAGFTSKRVLASHPMTLNITLASRWLLAQSSDFRLTRGGTSLTDAAQKQIVLHYPDWSGLLCYTGVASFGTHDTARWLTDIVSHPPDDRSPDDLVRLLVAEGNKWLPQVPAAYRRHTFTLLTYVRSKPHVYIISN